MQPDRKTILLVEDDSLIAAIERARLEGMGYAVRHEETGEAAVEAATGGAEIDLILMDIDLGPGMDGTTAAAAILKARDIPVVFLSSHAEKEIVERTEKITSYGYVLKDSKPTILNASIKMAFKLFEANRKIRAAGDRMRATLEAVPDLLFEVDLEGRYYDFHSPVEGLLFKPVEEQKGRKIDEVLPPGPARVLKEAIAEANEKGRSLGKSYELQVAAGSLWFEISVSRIAGYPELPRFIILARDVTERIQREFEIEAGATRYRSILSAAMDGFWLLDTAGTILETNEAACRLSGFGPGELIGSRVADMETEGGGVRLTERLGGIAARGTGRFESRIRRKDGGIVDIEASVAYLPLEGGRLVCFIRDITSLKRAEEALRESEARFRSLFDNTVSANSLYEVVEDGEGRPADYRYLAVNKAFERLVGMSSSELVGKTLLQLFPRTEAHWLERIGEVHLTGRSSRIDAYSVELDAYTDLYIYAPRPGQVAMASFDITDRKRAETALKESEESLAITLQSIGDAVIATDTEGRVTRMNPTAERLTGWAREEARGRPLAEVFRAVDSGARVPLRDPVAAALARGSGAETIAGCALLSRDGREYRVSETASPIRDAAGAVRGAILVFADVTDLTMAQETLERSEEKYRRLIENSLDVIFTLSAGGDFTFVSPAWTRLMGQPPEEALGRPFGDYVHPDDAAACREWLRAAAESRPEAAGIEYRARHADGSWRWHATKAAPLRDESGAVGGLQGVIRDISERKAMEAELEAKSEELDLYFDSALDLLCIADTSGRFLRLNPEWEKVLGYPLSEMEGKPFLELVHPDDVEPTLGAIATLDSQGEVLSFVNRYRRSDGAWRWIEWRSRPRGRLIYAAARDVTDRKRAEEEIRSLLAEKELILREVHHRLKNNMGAIASLLELQAQQAGAGGTALAEAAERLQSMVLLYDKLYKSENCLSLPLAEYLSSLADQVVSNFAGSARVRLEKRLEDLSVDADRAQPLGIIANELLANCMKHAFRGRTEGRVEIEVRRRGENGILAVGDDGIGMPASAGFERPSGFGHTLIGALAAQLGGRIRIERGNGTRVVLEFPL